VPVGAPTHGHHDRSRSGIGGRFVDECAAGLELGGRLEADEEASCRRPGPAAVCAVRYSTRTYEATTPG
jgi:hypothetical protein